MTKAFLGTCLMVAVLLPASALGQSIATAQPSVHYRQGESCVRQVTREAVVIRCVVAEGPRLLSDHGMAAGEPYDAQGNLVDRHGNIIATHGPDGRAIHVREVFTAEPNALR